MAVSPSPTNRPAAGWTFPKPWRVCGSSSPKSTEGTSRRHLWKPPPKQTKAYLQEHFVKLSSYSTVSTNTANGNSNMKLALSKVNGTILQPGEEFSYNTTLGDSTDPNNGCFPPEVFPAASSCRCTAAVFARVPQPCTLPPSTPAWRLWSAGNTPSPPPIAPLVGRHCGLRELGLPL